MRTSIHTTSNNKTGTGGSPILARIVDGAVSLALVVAIATLAGVSVERADWTDLALPLPVIAGVAAVFGALLARLRLADVLAHLLAMVVGIGGMVYLILRRVPLPEDEAGLAASLRMLIQAGVDWYLGQSVDPLLESLLVTLLMGSVLWLVGYLAAWCLVRRNWVFATVVLPGFLILINLANVVDPPAWILLTYGLLTLVLLVRQNLRIRRQRWARWGLASSGNMTSLILIWGTAIALVATTLGALAPASVSQATFQPLVTDIGQRAMTLQEDAANWVDSLTGQSSSGQVPVTGSFSAFDDDFAIGGPLELSNTPQALVSAGRAPYLSAQSYDSYTGRGWYSTVEDTFNPAGPNGRRYSPEMTFGPNQDVPLSASVLEGRTTEAMVVTPLAPTNGRLLTVGTYQASSIESSVRMSWLQLDGTTFDLQAGSIADLPRELQPITTLLLAARLDPEGEGEPEVVDGPLQREIQRQQASLSDRFLDVTFTSTPEGRVASLVVTGQIPVYDDVEAVFSRGPLDTGVGYRVVASTSEASGTDLASAGTAYPDWVVDRYLTLPDTVTPRTVELALQIAEPHADPFARAEALESFIRSAMIYDETVTAPPDDADIVDYLLFERQRGYCEYSASAMTVMLRAIGIPARVVVGFAPGSFSAEDQGFLYLQSNAHAWTEAYFPGFGWIAFEPTPAYPLPGDEGTGQILPEDTLLPTPEPEAPVTPPTVPVEESTPVDTPVIDDGTPAPPMPTEVSDDGSGGVPWLALGLTGFVTAAVAAAWLAWVYPLRGLAPSSALYARLRRLGSMLGVRPGASATPREFGRSMAERAPGARVQIERIVKTYEIDQYGPTPADGRWLGAAADAWVSIRRQAPRWLLPWRRGGG